MLNRKYMVWTVALATMLSALPVMAGEDGGDADKSAKKDGKKADPILRLVEIKIDEFTVPARALNLPLPGRTRTITELLDKLDELAEDEKVGAVLLNLGSVRLSLADVQEVQNGLARFQEANKKVLAFLNSGTPPAYMLACQAEEIAIAPTGNIIIPGLGSLFTFLKGHYQMMGVEYDVITAGKYKYPGFLNSREPNKYFEEEFGAIFDGLYEDYVNIIAKGRNISAGRVEEHIDTALMNADQALQRGLVDTVAYYDEYRDQVVRREKMKRRRGDSDRMANVNSIQDLIEMINDEMKKAEDARKAVGPKIAVLHARGPIIDFSLGAGFASQVISRDDFVKVVNELRKNDSIKAVVLRIDSPGGSGYASDVIWQQLRKLDGAKPLVVSMGRVAGSGGYYIACPARAIYAQPTTITGSIGVLGMWQNAWSLFNRADYNITEMKRGKRGTLGAPHRELSKEDRAFVQDYMNDFYGVFIDRVASTRRMPDKEVRKIAEGRIYTGRQALELGLVDELGGVAEAIEAARKMANIPPSAELKIVHYPRPGSLGEIFQSLSSVSMGQAIEMFRNASAPAPTLSLEQQLQIFSHGFQPLCWMAMPDMQPMGLNMPSPTNSLFMDAGSDNLAEKILEGWR